MEELIVGSVIAVGLLILGALLDLVNKVSYKDLEEEKIYVWWHRDENQWIAARVELYDKAHGWVRFYVRKILRQSQQPGGWTLTLGQLKSARVVDRAHRFYRPFWRIGPMVAAGLLGVLALFVTGDVWMPVASIVGAVVAGLVHGLRVPS